MRWSRPGSRSILMTDASQVGEARRLAAAAAARLGFGETQLGHLAIVVTELARNLVVHATGGELLVRPLDEGEEPGVEVLALDRGPGIPNTAESLRDGYSTAGTPGTGLGAVRRLSGLFGIHSLPGAGTAMLARVYRESPARARGGALSEIGAICLPMPGEEVSGDGFAVQHGAGRSTVLVADGIGHGPSAADAAEQAIAVFRRHADASPVDALGAIHAALRGTRGAAAAVAQLDPGEGRVRFAGVGNIAGVVLSATDGPRHVVSHNGTVGHHAPRVQEFTYGWPPGALLVLHSDGLMTRWALDNYPGLTAQHPTVVAGVLYRDFARGRDDVTVVVARNGAEGPLPR